MNIAKITEKYVDDHHNIRSALKKGLINYSALARLISKENQLSDDKFDAVLIACRRYREKMGKADNTAEIVSLLKKSRIEVKNRVLTAVLDSSINLIALDSIEKKARNEKEIFRVIEGASAYTLICQENYVDDIRRNFKSSLIGLDDALVEVTLKTSIDIEKIPGVMAFLYSKIADSGINIIHTLSCYTDTIFVIKESDLSKVMEILRF